MYSFIFVACLTLGTSLIISGVQSLDFPDMGYPDQYKLSNSTRANMLVTVKLLPYEILHGKATSYADVSLTIANAYEKNIEVEVTQIEILTVNSDKVLMSATAEMGLPKQISLKPNESKVLEYRLQSPSRIYRRGQDAIARIRYRQFGQSEQVVQSNPEAVAFMIP